MRAKEPEEGYSAARRGLWGQRRSRATLQRPSNSGGSRHLSDARGSDTASDGVAGSIAGAGSCRDGGR